MNFQKQQKPTVKVGVVDATKHYSTRTGVIHALEGVSFDVREGELVCVLGPSRLRQVHAALVDGRPAFA